MLHKQIIMVMFSKVWIFRFRDHHRMESDDSLLSDLIDTHTVLPWIIARGEYSFFRTKRERFIRGRRGHVLQYGTKFLRVLIFAIFPVKSL